MEFEAFAIQTPSLQYSGLPILPVTAMSSGAWPFAQTEFFEGAREVIRNSSSEVMTEVTHPATWIAARQNRISTSALAVDAIHISIPSPRRRCPEGCTFVVTVVVVRESARNRAYPHGEPQPCAAPNRAGKPDDQRRFIVCRGCCLSRREDQGPIRPGALGNIFSFFSYNRCAGRGKIPWSPSPPFEFSCGHFRDSSVIVQRWRIVLLY